MPPFATRSPLAPLRGRLGLVLLLVVAALAWRGRHLLPLAEPILGTLSGRVHVADGDSLTLDGERIRLAGIDAPERGQTCRLDGAGRACGEAARDHLVALIAGRPVECDWTKLDKYGRRLARCRAGGVDLAAAMVRDGWAVAYGAHEREEADARAARRGLWAGTFERPEDFRRAERAHRSGALWEDEE